MAQVQVVNAGVIEGVRREKDEVIDVSAGRARDLKNAGKVRTAPAAVEPVPTPAPVKPGKPAETKEAKNG